MYSSAHYLRFPFCLLLSFILFIGSAIGINADSPTNVFISECGLTAKGYFTYMYSENNYTPVNNLNGKTLDLYFTAEAEHKILWDSKQENYITNASQNTVTGFLNLYNFKIDSGKYVAVYQPHNYKDYTRDIWAYYKVTIVDKDIDTDLLYRSDRSNSVITYIISGIILIIIYSIFKMLRRER